MSDVIKRLVQRVAMMFGRALTSSVDDSGGIQLMKIDCDADEVIDGVERVQNYGFTSVPPVDSCAIVAYINGVRDDGVVITCDSGEHRVTGLSDGDVAVYSKHGQKISMQSDSNTTITGGSTIIGNGTDYVAMSLPTQAIITTIKATCDAFVPPLTPDGGAKLAQDISTALSALLPVASTNLKAD